jgi:hypothetical protein
MRVAYCDTTKVEDVAPLLPANYRVIGVELSTSRILIGGEDNAGWTLDGYVIPRLGSSLVYTEEIK